MNKHTLFVFFILLSLNKSYSYSRDVNFFFFGRTLLIEVNYEFQSISSSCSLDEVLWEMNYYQKELSEEDFEYFNRQIEDYVQKLYLDDYGRKLLFEHFFNQYFEEENTSTLFYSWYFLNKLSYNVILVNQNCIWEIFTTSTDSIRMPSINIENNIYYLLNNKSKINIRHLDDIYIYTDYIENKGAKSMSISSLKLDSFYLEPKNINIEFAFGEKNYFYTVIGNLNISNYFLELPNFEHLNVFYEIGCENNLKNTLIDFIEKSTQALDFQKSINFALKFVQDGIQYNEEDSLNHNSIWQFPETTLLLKKGDCEDKSILFAYIVKNVFDLECILLDYGDHVNVGVSVNMDCKPSNLDLVQYKGLNYYVCEPTGRGFVFGQMPKEYKLVIPKIYGTD